MTATEPARTAETVAPAARRRVATMLIANRGEIAVRIAATCRRLGIRSVAVYPEADSGAAHVEAADAAVALGPDPRAYLDIDAIVAAAQSVGADAIHPGYGFLSENPGLPRACADAGMVFIGPGADVIEAMGSKISAKAIAVDAGVPVVPGRFDAGLSDDDILAAVVEIGVPVLLKASAGGGGKGMRVVSDPGDTREAIAAARRESAAAFGDDALMVERFVAAPRHIEVQVLGDRYGDVVAIADRECSLQRRHQKVIEEAPVTSLTAPVRAAIAADAVAIAKAVGYVGAGTVEFLVDGTDSCTYYFLEVNTRLQVEHPVTEQISGLDLVAWQIAVAEGASVADLDVVPQGVAVEARIYAEDPANDFLPTGGRLAVCDLPEDLVRVDSGIAAGGTVSSHYDPMLAKIIATGPDRAAAYRSLAAALRRSTIFGVTTNLGYLTRLLADERVLANEVHTRWIDEQPELMRAVPLPHVGLAAAALDRWLPRGDHPRDPWSAPSGWRLGEHAWAGWRFRSDSATHDVLLRAAQRGGGVEVQVLAGGRLAAEPVVVDARRDGRTIVMTGETGVERVDVAHLGERVWIGIEGQAWQVTELSRLAADRSDEAATDLAPVRSPMPGTVIAVSVAQGQPVSAGDALVTVEAMKMEHTLRATRAGTVAGVLVAVGDRVRLEQELLHWEAEDA